jgi:lysozyme
MKVYPIDEIADRLKVEEGWSPTVYQCSQNKWTLGWGRNVDSTGPGITKAEGEILLRNDIDRTIKELRAALPWFDELDMTRTAVLVEVAFQMGLTTLRKFKLMLAALERGDNAEAANQLLSSKYARQVPARAQRYAERLRG